MAGLKLDADFESDAESDFSSVSEEADGAAQQFEFDRLPEELRKAVLNSAHPQDVLRYSRTSNASQRLVQGTGATRRAANSAARVNNDLERYNLRNEAGNIQTQNLGDAQIMILMPRFRFLDDSQQNEIVEHVVNRGDEFERAQGIASLEGGWSNMRPEHRENIVAAAANINRDEDKFSALSPLGRHTGSMRPDQQTRWAAAVAGINSEAYRATAISNIPDVQSLSPDARGILQASASSMMNVPLRTQVLRHLGLA